MRLAGMSRSQIADALGLGSGGEPLGRWLRGVPAPAWTRRPNAKDDLRKTAVAMREEGRSYREIGEVVGVSKGTLSLWLRDIGLTEEQHRALTVRGPEATAGRHAENRSVAARRRADVRARAKAQIEMLSESELFVAGVVAYWAEGAKNKPWRHGQSVRFMNSDPAMIRLFMSWLTLIGVADDRVWFRLQIHESASVENALRFWAEQLGVGRRSFLNTTLKRHNPKTVRKNVGESYHGCLCVEVRRSADLNLQIDGWCEGLAAATQRLVAG
jgi:transcriptional regulator with XRE-family HTH domain